MHQMLAKQHQFKIMKHAGKDIQNLYKKHRLQNKDDYYSYEALAVQCEASRMTLEAIYDDIFAAQHGLLAKLKHVESGGNMTNYSISSPSSSSSPNQQKSTAPNQNNQTTEPQDDGERLSTSEDDDLEDITASMNMLKTPTAPLAESTNSVLIPSFRTGQSSTPQSTSMTTTTTTAASASMKLSNSTSNESNYSTVKSVRERRREIEQKRLARPSPQSVSGGTYSTGMGGMESPNYARTRLRELESARMVSPSLTGATDKGRSDRTAARGGGDNEDGELKERRGARKVVTPA